MGPPACLYLCSSLAGALLLFPWKPFHQIPPHNRRGDRDISKGCQTLLHELSQLWWVHPHQSVTLASCRLSSQVSVRVAGHGAGYQPPKCSNVKLDAITGNSTGKLYAFAGNGLLMCIKGQSFLHHKHFIHGCIIDLLRTHLHAPGPSARWSSCLPHHSFVEGGGWKSGCSIYLHWQCVPNQGTYSDLLWH